MTFCIVYSDIAETNFNIPGGELDELSDLAQLPTAWDRISAMGRSQVTIVPGLSLTTSRKGHVSMSVGTIPVF